MAGDGTSKSAAMRRGAGDPMPNDLLAAVAERQSANKKEPEAVHALGAPELCLNLGF
jgi:hypothetical protein